MKVIKLDFDTGNLLKSVPQDNLIKQDPPKGPCHVTVRKANTVL